MLQYIFSILLILSVTDDCYAWTRYNNAFPENAQYMTPVSLNETLRQMYADSTFKIKPVMLLIATYRTAEVTEWIVYMK